MDENDLTTEDAAAILGVTPAHVRWYFRNGYLPGRRIGKVTLVFQRADVEKLVKNKPKKTGRPPAAKKAPARRKPRGKGKE